MRQTVRTIIIAWALLIGLWAAQPAHAQDVSTDTVDRDEVERLVERHTSNNDIQSERPEWTPEPPEARPRNRNPIIEAIGDFFAWLFDEFGGLFKYLMIVVIAGAILYALWYMFGDVAGLQFQRKQRKDGPDISEIDTQRPDPARARTLLEEADALAAEGRFAEAVHLLLFRSIDDLRERRSGGVPQSLTAREISLLSDLTERTRAALSPIIRIVENSFFGGRPVDRDGWQRARNSYESFAFGEAPA